VARYSGKKQISDQTRSEALALARGTQKPGQTKAQTKLIAQGIERGIDLYKKEQKEKARALARLQRDKRLPAGHVPHAPDAEPDEPAPASTRRRSWLPWLLLGLTWAGIGTYWLLGMP